MWVKSSYTRQLEGDLELGRGDTQQAQERANGAVRRARYTEEAAVQMEEELKSEIAKKDKLILEWMHSNYAFKKLTKDYAAQLGIPEEQRQIDALQARVDAGEEDPAFKHSKLYDEAVEELKKRKPKP